VVASLTFFDSEDLDGETGLPTPLSTSLKEAQAQVWIGAARDELQLFAESSHRHSEQSLQYALLRSPEQLWETLLAGAVIPADMSGACEGSGCRLRQAHILWGMMQVPDRIAASLNQDVGSEQTPAQIEQSRDTLLQHLEEAWQTFVHTYVRQSRPVGEAQMAWTTSCTPMEPRLSWQQGIFEGVTVMLPLSNTDHRLGAVLELILGSHLQLSTSLPIAQKVQVHLKPGDILLCNNRIRRPHPSKD